MYRFLKRFLDVFLSGLALIVLSPILIPIVILLKLTGEGEVFYRQPRVGYKNKEFLILKFATMLKDSPNLGTGDVTLRGDPRITKVGGFLRMTKINELPQLINILKGDMSIVGPRPLMKAGFLRYSDILQRTVYNAVPGLTGIGSVLFRDEELIMTNSKLAPHESYEKEILPYKGTLEMWYQKHQSLYTDLMIIFLTAWVIIFPKSKLPFKVFKDLPPKPKNLIVS